MCNRGNDSNREQIHAARAVMAAAALVAALLLRGTSTVQAAQVTNPGVIGGPAFSKAGKVRGTATEWLSYGGDKASTKYSPLGQIGSDDSIA